METQAGMKRLESCTHRDHKRHCFVGSVAIVLLNTWTTSSNELFTVYELSYCVLLFAIEDLL